jgi:uncharacterized membrane protein YecN with MAPEG domain
VPAGNAQIVRTLQLTTIRAFLKRRDRQRIMAAAHVALRRGGFSLGDCHVGTYSISSKNKATSFAGGHAANHGYGPNGGLVASGSAYTDFGSRCKLRAGMGWITAVIRRSAVPATIAPAVTLLIAAALGLINLWLAIRASRVRISQKILMGDNDNPLMRARMRAHANFNEYVPIALILMALIELRVGASAFLWGIGLALVVGRLLHPFGLDRPAPNALRISGIMLTWAVLIALVIWALILSFTAVPSGIRYF